MPVIKKCFVLLVICQWWCRRK